MRGRTKKKHRIAHRFLEIFSLKRDVRDTFKPFDEDRPDESTGRDSDGRYKHTSRQQDETPPRSTTSLQYWSPKLPTRGFDGSEDTPSLSIGNQPGYDIDSDSDSESGGSVHDQTSDNEDENDDDGEDGRLSTEPTSASEDSLDDGDDSDSEYKSGSEIDSDEPSDDGIDGESDDDLSDDEADEVGVEAGDEHHAAVSQPDPLPAFLPILPSPSPVGGKSLRAEDIIVGSLLYKTLEQCPACPQVGKCRIRQNHRGQEHPFIVTNIVTDTATAEPRYIGVTGTSRPRKEFRADLPSHFCIIGGHKSHLPDVPDPLEPYLVLQCGTKMRWHTYVELSPSSPYRIDQLQRYGSKLRHLDTDSARTLLSRVSSS